MSKEWHICLEKFCTVCQLNAQHIEPTRPSAERDRESVCSTERNDSGVSTEYFVSFKQKEKRRTRSTFFFSPDHQRASSLCVCVLNVLTGNRVSVCVTTCKTKHFSMKKHGLMELSEVSKARWTNTTKTQWVWSMALGEFKRMKTRI